jgi:hypothetical protein
MILGAVMGAAGRIEADRRRQRQASPGREDTQSTRSGKPSARPGGFDLPGLDDKELRAERLREVFKHRPGERAAEPVPDGAASRRTDAHADFHQRFGSYASHAQAELATYRDLDDGETDEDKDTDALAQPANSNTAPGKSAQAAEPADIVVPFPAPRGGAHVRTTQALAERLSAALAAIEEPAATEPSIDVEMTRETATFRLPVSQATLPEGLAALAQRATCDSPATERLQLEQALAEPETTETPDIIGDEEPDTGEAPAFEPPLVLRRMAE